MNLFFRSILCALATLAGFCELAAKAETQAAEAASKKTKTLVSWVALANTTQQGGSALTIQREDKFDGVVFGERTSAVWMSGSDFFSRTQGDQKLSVAEKADREKLVQIAIVYRDDQTSIYRNGELYASYPTSNIDLLSEPDLMAVLGLRHVGATTGQTLQGFIEDARIYSQPLTADALKQLFPNKESTIKPIAWWTFEKDEETDRTGRFPINVLAGDARIEGGRLVLPTNGASLIAASREHQVTLASDKTPAMPRNPPASWPTYHLLHPGPGDAMPGDPNCAFFWKGRYHLHYIYNHIEGFAFAHVSSDDMLHWKWHPTTLTPKFTGHGMFSGTGLITKDNVPAIVYHGQGSGRNQIAFARDDALESWTKPVAIIPKNGAGETPDFKNWDPDCWLNNDTYYALSGGPNPSLMKSLDLKNWKFLGPLLHDDYPSQIGVAKDEDISCANMFKLGDKWMLLCISHRLGCRYYLGDFKDEKFLPDFHAMMSWNGNNFFAPESLLTQDGRRVMWAWLLNLPVAPRGIQSLPRELELPADGRLRIRPLRELESLRADLKQRQAIEIKSGETYPLDEMGGDAMELEVTFDDPRAKQLGIDVLCDSRGANGLRIAIMPAEKKLKIGDVEAPFELEKGEALKLRIFIDANLVEVFANDRQAALATKPYDAEKLDTRLFSEGCDSRVSLIKKWKMNSIFK